jgi:hypothetical protein
MSEAKIPIINVNVPEPWHSVIAALTARAEAAEIDWEENNALAAAKVCLEAENATLTARVEATERRLKLLEEVIDEEMVVSHLGVFERDDDPKVALNKLQCYAQDLGSYFAQDELNQLKAENATLRTQLQQAEQDREEAHAMVRETARLRDQDQTIAANMIGRKNDHINGLNKELDALKLELKKVTGQRDTLRAEMNAEENK